MDSSGAIELIKRLEVLGRRLDAARVELVELIDRKGLYRADGHHSAEIMVRQVAKLSGAEAAARAKAARALRDLPETRAAFRAGEVGSCQVRRLARAHANPRVRDRLPELCNTRLPGLARPHRPMAHPQTRRHRNRVRRCARSITPGSANRDSTRGMSTGST